MCVALPGRVTEILDDKYVNVDFSGNKLRAASGLIDVRMGDRVLVHAGCIIQKVSDEEAEEIERIFEDLEGADGTVS